MLVGFPCNLVYGTRDQNGEPSQWFRALFMQETIKRGLLMPSLIVSYSHTDEDVDRTVAAIHDALYVYRRALDEGVEKYLVGGPTQPVFRRYNRLMSRSDDALNDAFTESRGEDEGCALLWRLGNTAA